MWILDVHACARAFCNKTTNIYIVYYIFILYIYIYYIYIFFYGRVLDNKNKKTSSCIDFFFRNNNAAIAQNKKTMHANEVSKRTLKQKCYLIIYLKVKITVSI